MWKQLLKVNNNKNKPANLEGEDLGKETINNIKFVTIRKNRTQSCIWLDLNVCVRRESKSMVAMKHLPANQLFILLTKLCTSLVS